MKTSRKTCLNPNHPAKGSIIKVEPIRDLNAIEDLKALLSKCPRDYCLFTLGINTAFRASELVSIKVGQVTHLKASDKLTVRQSKNGKTRTVTINDKALEAIQKCLKNHPHLDNPFAPLLYSKTTSKHLKPNTISKYMKGWCKRIGIVGNYASHTMRKTWGYHVYRNYYYHQQIDQKKTRHVIAELMVAYGHATERQTIEYLCIEDQDISRLYMENQL